MNSSSYLMHLSFKKSETMTHLLDTERPSRRRFYQRPAFFVIQALAIIVLYVQISPTIDFEYRHGGKFLHYDSTGTFESFCSRDADGRGHHQKIIAYSIYGNFSAPKFASKYLRFFRETLNSVPVAYPGWVVRIYHNLTIDDAESWKVLKGAIDFGTHIDFCNATELIKKHNLSDIFAMTWRWLPLLDDMVDTLISRDSDSKIIDREQDAVREWLASNRTFHIMRDHPQHCVPILGCCWGVKISKNRSIIIDAAQKMFHQNHLHQYAYDQQLLHRLFWPIAKTNMIAHDSYCCEKFRNSQPYPTQRKDGLFVGGREFPSEELKSPCPRTCRPANTTSEWNYC